MSKVVTNIPSITPNMNRRDLTLPSISCGADTHVRAAGLHWETKHMKTRQRQISYLHPLWACMPRVCWSASVWGVDYKQKRRTFFKIYLIACTYSPCIPEKSSWYQLMWEVNQERKQASLKLIPLGPGMIGWNMSKGNHRRNTTAGLHDITCRNQRKWAYKLCRKNLFFCLSGYKVTVCFLNDNNNNKLWKIWAWYFALLGKSFCIYWSWQGNKMPEIFSVCCAWRQIIAEEIVPHASNKNTVVHNLKSYEKKGGCNG